MQTNQTTVAITLQSQTARRLDVAARSPLLLALLLRR